MLIRIIKKTIIIYSAFGFVGGIGMLIYSFFNDVPFYLGDKEIHGIMSGIISVPFMPFIAAIIGFFHAIMFWFPLTYIYTKLKERYNI